jgi:hypothetical protein
MYVEGRRVGIEKKKIECMTGTQFFKERDILSSNQKMKRKGEK